MKKIFILFFVLTLIQSCSNGNKNQIEIFNGISFITSNGEAETSINSKVNNKYTEYFNNDSIQIPLFKYIKHSDYDIFIGIPYNTSIKNMSQKTINQDSLEINIKSDSIFLYKTYKRNKFYIAEYATKTSNNSLIYIAAMSKMKEITDSLFTEIKLSNRIKISSK